MNHGRLILSLVLLVASLTASAGVSAQNETMYIFKDGLIVGQYDLSEIDRVRFFLPGAGTVTDIDGNEYPTVTICEQAWMASSLRVTRYPDGSPIPVVSSDSAWADLDDNGTDDAYTWYDNDPGNAESIGALYTWAAAMGDNAVASSANPSGVQGACPDGWHLPSIAEWAELKACLTAAGHEDLEGLVLKSVEWGGEDYYGFEALPAGIRNYITGRFSNLTQTTFQSTTEQGVGSATIDVALLVGNNSRLELATLFKSGGHSVRCVKD